MCGLAGIISLGQHPISFADKKLKKMDRLIAHRGPDDNGTWVSPDKKCALSHRRLSIIDVSAHGHQPMIGEDGNVLVFNGAIYNHKALREQLKSKWTFTSHSDSEVILAAYHVYGKDCVKYLRGMFSFAIWDGQHLFSARDRFGIKPFYYAIIDNTFYFASEVKAILPFLKDITTDQEGFSEYISFQAPVGEKTLFSGVYQLLPGHSLQIVQGKLIKNKYWDIDYSINHDLTAAHAAEKINALMQDSIEAHLESDVPVGAYVGGGMDSSLVALLSSKHMGRSLPMFHGKFTAYPGYDESFYAHEVANQAGSVLHVADLTAADFADNIQKVIHHMDYPVAGPGAFAQYMISKVASEHVKVVLGGQGGDEIFGGYARYLVTYFEQCIKASIENDVCPYKLPISPQTSMNHLSVLKDYKPMIKQVWSKGLFEPFNERYFAVVNRAMDFQDELNPEAFQINQELDKFTRLLDHEPAFNQASYFERMMRFDFKYLMPGLLHVEDRVSMAHGLEARVPFLDHPLVEFMATVPAGLKFQNGQMKSLMKQTFSNQLPRSIVERKDKMGFPVPLTEWMKADLREFIFDTLATGASKHREFIDYKRVIKNCESTGRYSRKLWAFLSYELWHQSFHDKKAEYLYQQDDELVV